MACKAKVLAGGILRRKVFVCDVWYIGLNLVPSHRRSSCDAHSWPDSCALNLLGSVHILLQLFIMCVVCVIYILWSLYASLQSCVSVMDLTIWYFICNYCRSYWPRALRYRSAATRLLGLWVRIPPGAGC